MDFAQENALWQHIQQQSDATEQTRQLLEMARLLLERAASNTETIASLDSDELTDFFLEYQGVGKLSAQFLQTALPVLDEAYQGTDFEQQLQDLQQQLHDCTQHGQAGLQQLKQLQQLRVELQQQQAGYQQQQIDIQQLEQQTQQLQSVLVQLQHAPQQAEAAIKSSEQQQEAALQGLVTLIPQVVQLIQANRASYQHHFAANQAISDALQATPSLTDISHYTATLNGYSAQLQELLDQFDQTLTQVVSMEEKQRHLLRELRDPRPSLTHPESEE